jgi:outer membrane autotransporter protein
VAGGGLVWPQLTNELVASGGTFVGGAGGIALTNEAIFITNLPPIRVEPILVMASMGELSVGRGGSYNSLLVENGAQAFCMTGIIGETSNAWHNVVSVVGANSEWRNSGDLYIGGRMSQTYAMTSNGWENDWTDGGRGNSLYVGDGGLVSVGRDMHNRNYSTVSIDPGSQINIVSNYYQDATSSLRFGVETNAAGAPLNALVSVGGTAEFEKGARIEYASNVGQLQFETFYTNKIIAAEKLIVAGVEDADSLDLEMLDASGTLVDVLFWENEQDIYGLVGRVYLADSAGFSSNSMMGILSKEIDDMSLLGDPNASTMINVLNTMSGSQQNAQLSQLYSRGTPNFLHGQSMTEGMREIKKHTTRNPPSPQDAPEGAAGPYRPRQGLQAWVKPYGAWADRSAQDGFSGYKHNVYGTIVGFDKPVGSALLGLAGGYGRSVINQDDGDYSQAKTGYGVLYLNWGTRDWFSDINLGFGRSKIEQNSGTVFANKADFDASNFAAYFGGGKEMKLKDGRFILTPKASMLWSYYYQQAYTDESATGVEREVASYERNSFLSSLGAAFAMQKEYDIMVLKPEARFYWLHEFNASAEHIDYQLVNGQGGEYHFLMPSPESNVLEAGLGVSCLFHDEMQIVFDVDWRFGQDYSAYAVSGRAVFEF